MHAAIFVVNMRHLYVTILANVTDS